MTNLESKELKGIGETRERLIAGTSLRNQSEGTSDTGRLPVGNLHASRLGNVVLEALRSGRGHAPTASTLERTGRISTDGGPRQHHRMCGKTRSRREA